MSEQAIETEDEIVIEAAAEEDVETPEEVDEVEIVVSGEEKPTSAPVPKGFIKRINKLNGKVSAANDEAEAQRIHAESLTEQNKLLQAQLQAKATLKRPKAEDFESDAEYEVAQDKYEDQRIAEAVRKNTEQAFSEDHARTTQNVQSERLDTNLKAHYERAESLKVPDYTDVEDIAINILGNDITKQIMASTGNSEVILYHLGKNPAKAENIVYLATHGDPMKAAVEIGGLSKSLTLKPKNSIAPDPETQIPAGNGIKSTKPGLEGVIFE